jgi:hypothetical protein
MISFGSGIGRGCKFASERADPVRRSRVAFCFSRNQASYSAQRYTAAPVARRVPKAAVSFTRSFLSFTALALTAAVRRFALIVTSWAIRRCFQGLKTKMPNRLPLLVRLCGELRLCAGA